MKDKIHIAMAFTILVILVLLLVGAFVSMNLLLFGINLPEPGFIGPTLAILTNALVVSIIVLFITEH